MSDILHFLSWYVIITLVGAAAFPLGYRFFSRLPGRGLTLARPLGLLLWGFIFWLLTSVGIFQNDLGGVISAFILLALLSAAAGWGKKFSEIIGWLKQNLKLILSTEILFFVAFLLWTLVRGMNPDAAYTEKPMELAFINSILRSPVFPPQDPWLSGYAISYYYFGYVMIAMLTRVSGVASSIAFNLSSSLWFALTAAALYGIVYDLVLTWQVNTEKKSSSAAEKLARTSGFLGPFFVLIASTFEGVLEFLHARGLFWHQKLDGTWTSKFWSWLSISDLNEAPMMPFSWIPSRSGWLWWRGSRLLQDISMSGNRIEVIDEFPFFSYLLSDLHPHVLAMPFGLLAVGVCLNFFLGAKQFLDRYQKIQNWMRHWSFWLAALILGSLAFINTWDFPIYVGLFCVTWAYFRYQENGWSWKILWELLKNGLLLGITGAILFLPFYIGFASQAGGILPSLVYMTKGIHFWILFGVLLLPIVGWLFFKIGEQKEKRFLVNGLKFSSILLFALFVLSLLYGVLIFSFQSIGPALAASSNSLIAGIGSKMMLGGSVFAGLHENYSGMSVIRETVVRRLQSPGTWITLGGMVALAFGFLFNRKSKSVEPENSEVEASDLEQTPDVEKFVLILLMLGLALTVFPEFFYLRDQFGWRMNTIFKFYFQAWILWGIVASVASVWLFQRLSKWKGVVIEIAWILTVLAGLVYPAVMLWDKTSHFSMKNWTLDGNAYIQRGNPDEYDAIVWLQKAPLGVVSEAIGGSYSDYARVSTRSGQPTVLGWPGHESQWRGGSLEMGSRFDDIRTLYETSSWVQAAAILEQYQVRYVFVGSLEWANYKVDTRKFDSMLEPVYNNQSVTIYEVPANVGELQP